MEEHRIGISFSLKRECVLIYHDTIKALGNPDFFRFLINEDSKKLAMEVCSYGDNGYHIVPTFKEGDSYEIYSIEMLKMIWDICGWKERESYRAWGELYFRERVIEFDLNMAETIVYEDL